MDKELTKDIRILLLNTFRDVSATAKTGNKINMEDMLIVLFLIIDLVIFMVSIHMKLYKFLTDKVNIDPWIYLNISVMLFNITTKFGADDLEKK